MWLEVREALGSYHCWDVHQACDLWGVKLHMGPSAGHPQLGMGWGGDEFALVENLSGARHWVGVLPFFTPSLFLYGSES